MGKPKFVKPFGLGDVVKYMHPISDGVYCDEKGRTKELFPSWEIGEEHIITEIKVRGVNEYDCATNIGAWIPHESFVLVREADAESIAKLISDDEDDYEDVFDPEED